MRNHWIHAALYDRMIAPLERDVLAPRRAALLRDVIGTVLDVGAGTGANLAHLTGAEAVVALEPDAAMRTRLQRAATASPAAIEVSAATGESLPFPDGRFDAVVCTCVLCTVEDADRVLQECRRVLRPDGRLIVLEHVRGTGRLARWQDRITPLWRRLNAGCHPNRDLRSAIGRAGFAELEVEEFQPMPSWIPTSPMLQAVATNGAAA